MAYTTIAKPSDHFDVPTWAGSTSTTTVSGMGFKPDIIMIKIYDGTGHPIWNNSSQGINYNYLPSQQGVNDTTAYVASYTSDGFTLTGSATDANENGENYMAATFKCNGGTTSSNSDGATTSTVQANTTSGVSIVTYTGTGSATTLGHGLGAAPKIIITKSLTTADYAGFGNGSTLYHSDPWTDYLQLAWNGSTLGDNDIFWNDTAPTTSVFSVKSANQTNKSGDTYVAYCFAEKKGFSKFGYYKGNGNASGPQVYCGFKPKLVFLKKADSTEEWIFKTTAIDHGQLPNDGEMKRTLKINSNNTTTNCTINANATGFRPTTTDGKANGDNALYLYMAFAEHSIVGTNGTVGLAI
jgi:hypothetical protein